MEKDWRNQRNMKFEYFLPSSWWTETADSHCLLIHVPGFKKEEVRIRADSDDHVIVSGERQSNDNTVLHFAQAYKVPDGCNIQETRAILEDETYYVIIPKKLDSENENPASTSDQTEEPQAQESVSDGAVNTSSDEFNQNRKEIAKEESSDTSLMKKLAKMIKKKRCLVLTALLALSLGLLVSHRNQSTPQQFKADEGLISYQKEDKKRAEDDA